MNASDYYEFFIIAFAFITCIFSVIIIKQFQFFFRRNKKTIDNIRLLYWEGTVVVTMIYIGIILTFIGAVIYKEISLAFISFVFILWYINVLLFVNEFGFKRIKKLYKDYFIEIDNKVV